MFRDFARPDEVDRHGVRAVADIVQARSALPLF
jgi:hypothetical protein